jgi:hypothetical protein
VLKHLPLVFLFFWRALNLVIRFGFVTVKNRNEAPNEDKERVKKRWEEHFKNLLRRDRVTKKV